MDGKPLTRGLDHIGLTVRNLNVTRDFFIQCLGWSLVGERPRRQRTLRDCADSGPGPRKASPRIGPMAGDDVMDRCRLTGPPVRTAKVANRNRPDGPSPAKPSPDP